MTADRLARLIEMPNTHELACSESLWRRMADGQLDNTMPREQFIEHCVCHVKRRRDAIHALLTAAEALCRAVMKDHREGHVGERAFKRCQYGACPQARALRAALYKDII